MAHCGVEEAANALAQIELTDATDALEVAESVATAAEIDLEDCEAEHGS